MRRRQNFQYRFGELPPSFQQQLVVWELFMRHEGVNSSIPKEQDNLSEFVREIKAMPPKLIPDNE
jgi:hypothetical protein